MAHFRLTEGSRRQRNGMEKEKQKLNLHEAIKELCLYLMRVNFVFVEGAFLYAFRLSLTTLPGIGGGDLNRTQSRLHAKRKQFSLSYREEID